jgi:hypothetical protein
MCIDSGYKCQIKDCDMSCIQIYSFDVPARISIKKNKPIQIENKIITVYCASAIRG